MLNPNVPSWFEIPTIDLDRAQRCYETLFDQTLQRTDFGGMPMAVFPYEKPGTSGALVSDPRARPSADGSVVYLGLDALDPVLGRVDAAGCQVLLPRTELPHDIGFIALLIDSEGNRIGLHAPR
jgi:predicted enzyme related to lactoylglutathione lyase